MEVNGRVAHRQGDDLGDVAGLRRGLLTAEQMRSTVLREARHWLRRAIYLDNESYPWFRKNPAWNNLRPNDGFERILEDLKKGFRKNRKTWKRLLEHVPAED